MGKSVQFPIELFEPEEFYEGLIYEWGYEEDEISPPIIFLYQRFKSNFSLLKRVNMMNLTLEFIMNIWLLLSMPF